MLAATAPARPSAASKGLPGPPAAAGARGLSSSARKSAALRPRALNSSGSSGSFDSEDGMDYRLARELDAVAADKYKRLAGHLELLYAASGTQAEVRDDRHRVRPVGGPPDSAAALPPLPEQAPAPQTHGSRPCSRIRVPPASPSRPAAAQQGGAVQLLPRQWRQGVRLVPRHRRVARRGLWSDVPAAPECGLLPVLAKPKLTACQNIALPVS